MDDEDDVDDVAGAGAGAVENEVLEAMPNVKAGPWRVSVGGPLVRSLPEKTKVGVGLEGCWVSDEVAGAESRGATSMGDGSVAAEELDVGWARVFVCCWPGGT